MVLALGDHVPTACSIATTLDWPVLAQIALFFGEAGAFVFGSGLAIVPFLYGGVVNEFVALAAVAGLIFHQHHHYWSSR